jgi:hypothetical protein
VIVILRRLKAMMKRNIPLSLYSGSVVQSDYAASGSFYGKNRFRWPSENVLI